jgi:cephalosporin hydroxylase
MTWQDVRGYFDFNKLYDEVVAAAPPDAILVEVGAWFGQSVIYLATRAKEADKGLRVFAVDTWRGSADHAAIAQDQAALQGHHGDIWRAFLANIRACGVHDIITPMCLPSIDAALYFENRSAFMVFIDAQHTYHAVKSDLLAWMPKVAAGGYMSGHDYGAGWPGVVQAVTEEVGTVTVYGSAWFKRL